MEFEFSDSQKQLKETARRFLADRSSIDVVRAVLDGPASFDRALWADLGGMGFLGTAIPEEFGGVGAGYLELCAVAEEMGRSLAPVPFSSSVYLAGALILEAGDDAQKRAWLPRIASGETIACLAFAEGVGQPRLDRADTLAKSTGGGASKLSGVKLPVADGDVADVAIVLAADPDAESGGISLFLVDLRQEGVARETLRTIDPTRGQARLSFTDAMCERIGVVGAGEEILNRIFDQAAILFAFEQVGGAERALEMAREYALDRFAFGRQIGSFQAIKHKLVDMYIAVVLARSNAYFGAWAVSAGAVQIPVAAASARISASHAFRYCTTEACHIFGAMGFTWESDCHLYFRRARLLALTLGGQGLWNDRLITGMNRLDGTRDHAGDQAA